MKVAIVGSTSQVGRSLALKHEDNGDKVYKYSRSLANIPKGFTLQAQDYPTDTDVIINCAMKGDPKIAYDFDGNDLEDYIDIDSHILNRISKKQYHFQYVYISSWVANPNSEASKEQQDYGAVKRFFELRHELLNERFLMTLVMNVRIRSFFSRFISINSGFLVAGILRNILMGEKLVIEHERAYYFYITPDELYYQIQTSLESKAQYLSPVGQVISRRELYDEIKRYVFTKESPLLSEGFKHELQKLLENYYAETSENPDIKSVGEVIYTA